MSITTIYMPGQNRVLTGMDWRSVRDHNRMHNDIDKIVMIDMTIEQRNKLDGLESWRYINIPTPDFQCPDWTAQQWLNLIAFVYNESNINSKKGSGILVACQGGQGRTGIALAILYATITENFVNPVKLIRQFNPHFIETPAQEAYVKRIVKEIELLTEPAVVIEPIDWPARAGKAEKRVAELEGKIAELVIENSTLRDQATYLKYSVSSLGTELSDALKSIAGVWELVNPFMDNENLEIGDLYDE